MKFVVLNPNTTVAMTDAVMASLAPRLPSGSQLVGLTARLGAAVIDSRETFVIGARSALSLQPEVAADADAVLLACFGDPGLDALRAASRLPVVGLAEAALIEVRRRGRRFAIVTAGANWVPMLRECAAINGAADLLVDVYALAGNGGDLRRDPPAFAAEVTRLAQSAAEHGAETLILGGAAFAGLRFDLPATLEVLDPLDCAAASLRTACADGGRLTRRTFRAARPRRSGPSSPTSL